MNQTIRHNGIAPSPSGFKLGGKSGTTARAWQWCWNGLADFRQGDELAKEAAYKYALRPTTIMSLLHRMAREGHLEVEQRTVATESQRTTKRREGGKVIKSTHPYRANVKKSFFRISKTRPQETVSP